MNQGISPDPEQKIIDEHRTKLLEFFDAVIIFASKHDGDIEQTTGFTSRGGSHYAHIGHVEQWLVKERQRAKNKAIRDDDEDE